MAKIEETVNFIRNKSLISHREPMVNATQKLFSVREKLKEMIKEKSLQFGDFTLRSGKKSKYYFDLKTTTLHIEAIKLLSDYIINKYIIPYKITAIGGIETGAIPIISGIITRADLSIKLNAFYIRKKPKNVGNLAQFEGNVDKNDSIMIIDDTITTGNSVMMAVNKIKEYFDLKPEFVLGIIDRGAKDNFKDWGIDYKYIFTQAELLSDHKP